MKKFYKSIISIIGLLVLFSSLNSVSFAQCTLHASASQYEIYCGQAVTLTAYATGADSALLYENFNTGAYGPGWGSTPGGTMWNNPCSPNGVDGTTHAWMGSSTSQPRDITSPAYNLTTATAGVTICFDMLYATQGGSSPCEGPDEPDEGVHLQYSIDGGITWIDMAYWDPNGGYDPQLTNWNNYCVTIPNAAITSSTQFRWHQDQTSSNLNDHWGLDNPTIIVGDQDLSTIWGQPGDNYYYSYPLGSHGGDNPNIVTPSTTTTYYVNTISGNNNHCSDSVTIVVKDPIYEINFDKNPITLCPGDSCAQVSGFSLQNFYDQYENKSNTTVSINAGPIPTIPGTILCTANDTVSNLSMTTIGSNSIQSVCIDSLVLPSTGNCSALNLSSLKFVLKCPSGSQVTLANVGNLSGNTIHNLCFETGGLPLSGGGSPYSGSYAPAQPFSNLSGCTGNGVWKLIITGSHNTTCNIDGVLSKWRITFTHSDTVNHYTWDSDPSISNLNDINTKICTPSSKDYVLHVSNGISGCKSASDTLKIIVKPTKPDIDFSITDIQCHDDCNGIIQTTINGGTAPYQYQWFKGTNVIPTSNSSLLNICSGNYSLIVTDASGCKGTADTIMINPPIKDSSFRFQDYCSSAVNQPDSIQSPNGTFSFDPSLNDGASINSTTGIITNGVSGTTYTVRYTTENGCSYSTQNVTVFESPKVNFTATPTQGEAPLHVNYNNQSTLNNNNYTWHFGDASTSNDSNLNINHIFNNGGTYETILVAESTNGCKDSSSVQIIVIPAKMKYQFPNVFTPDNDNSNDYFAIIDPMNIKEIDLIILNRWGNVVYKSNDVNFKWNGRVNDNGNECADGVYYYKAQLKGLNDKSEHVSGFIHLIRK